MPGPERSHHDSAASALQAELRAVIASCPDYRVRARARQRLVRLERERSRIERCTCDRARPYWHSFHREGCPLAR